MKKRILLLSGTCEGPPLARALLEAGLEVHATVTREEARDTLFGPLQGEVRVEARGFTEQGLEDFLAQGGADGVLDATHPFAARITRIAHTVCGRMNIPYVRYERPDWQPPPEVRQVGTFVEAAALLPALGARCLLTIGAKQLGHFAHLQGGLFLMARTLPCVASLERARAAGFTPDRVLGMRPPFSRELERALLRNYAIDVLLTKASGREGGVEEKVLAARELGVEVVMVRRPVLADVPCLHTLEAAVQACVQRAGGGP